MVHAWDTQIDRGIVTLLSNRNIFPRDHHQIWDKRQIFFNVPGFPVKEDGGHSITNPNGVEAVAEAALMCMQIVGINAGDIGIITHYSEDKRCLRQALAARGIDVEVDIEVSTVDAFQGKEKEIVLIHFFVANEADHPFGFVAHPNRLCVATTRAKRLQLMFGNLTFWETAHIGRGVASRVKQMLDLMDYVRRNRQVIDWINVRPRAGVTRPIGNRAVQGQQRQDRIGELEARDMDEPEVVF